MQHLGCPTVASYLKILDGNPEALQECEHLLTVSISRFFRDHRVWTVVHDVIIPDLIGKNRHDLVAWFAGCAQ